MTTLTELRKELVGLLVVAELPAEDGIPGRVEPPVLLVQPSPVWVEKGQTFRELLVNFDVFVVVGYSADNGEQTRELEALASRTLAAIMGEDSRWSPGELSEPYVATVNDRQWLTARVTASRQYEPTE